jgi:hypothetical protein
VKNIRARIYKSTTSTTSPIPSQSEPEQIKSPKKPVAEPKSPVDEAGGSLKQEERTPTGPPPLVDQKSE